MPRKRDQAEEQVAVGSCKRFLVLALTAEREGHGWDIGTRYVRRFGALLPMKPNGVYRILDSLEAQDLLTGVLVARDPLVRARGRRTRTFAYHITTAGEDELRQWVGSQAGRLPWRIELLARLYAASIVSVEVVPELIARYERTRAAEEHELTRQMADLSAGPPTSARLACRLVLEERLCVLAGQRTWTESAAEQLHQYRRPR